MPALAGMNTVDPQIVVDIVQKRAWLPLGALAVGLCVRLLKSDIRFFPNVPPQWRVWASFGFGQIAGILESVMVGKTYKEAILWGLTQSVIAIVGHNTIVESMRRGKEFSIPGITKIVKITDSVKEKDAVKLDV